jgi:HlyD family secretion protein
MSQVTSVPLAARGKSAAWRRRAILLGIVPVVAAGLVGTHLYGRGNGGQTGFRTAKVERGSLTATVATTGTLNAVVTVQVGTQVSGQIQELLANFNSRVTKGQLIARIDPAIFQSRVVQARADVEAAEANVLIQRAQVERARADVQNAQAALASAQAQTAKAEVAWLDAKRDLDRKNFLASKRLIAQSDKDISQGIHDAAKAQIATNRAQEEAFTSAILSAQAQLRVAQAQLQSAHAGVRQKQGALQQAIVDLDHTTIRSPVDGVVISRDVALGQTVAASLSSPTLYTIAQDLKKMQVDTNVDEADMGRIREGQRATFTVDSFRGEVFEGSVAEVRLAPKVVQNVVTYNVVIAFNNPDQKLLPGLTANIRIMVDNRSDALKIPNAALRFRPSSGAVAANSEADPRPSSATSVESVEKTKQLLAHELKLTEGQQRALEPILEERRQQLVGVERLPPPQRRSAALRVRDDARGKMRALLTAEQQNRYDQLSIGEPTGSDSGGRPGTVWVLNEQGRLRAVPLRLGITDGSSTEVLGGDLKEGREIIVGTSSPSSSSPPSSPMPSSSPPSGAPAVRPAPTVSGAPAPDLVQVAPAKSSTPATKTRPAAAPTPGAAERASAPPSDERRKRPEETQAQALATPAATVSGAPAPELVQVAPAKSSTPATKTRSAAAPTLVGAARASAPPSDERRKQPEETQAQALVTPAATGSGAPAPELVQVAPAKSSTPATKTRPAATPTTVVVGAARASAPPNAERREQPGETRAQGPAPKRQWNDADDPRVVIDWLFKR